MPDIYGYQELPRMVFERPPLLMLDRIAVDVDACRADGIKSVSMNEHFFQGHFPDAPVMPAVLQTAAMCQLGTALMREKTGDHGAIYLLAELSRIKFRSPVRPGDVLSVTVDFDDTSPDERPLFKAKASVGDTVASEGGITLQRYTPEALLRKPEKLTVPFRDTVQSAAPQALDTSGIMNTIPHRYPFLLIDRVLELDRENNRIVVLKNVTGNEDFFRGLPVPVLPPYIQAEIGAQAGCALALSLPENANKLAFFMSLDTANFMSPVVPGDQLLLDVEVSGRGRFGRGAGTMTVGDRVVSEVSLKFAIIAPEEAEE